MKLAGFTEMKQACSCFPVGVAVVTSRNASGELIGLTISSFTSISLDPPLILICVHENSRVLDSLVGSGCFTVNVLASDQQHMSKIFSSHAADRVENIGWYPGARGAPVLADALAVIECQLREVVRSADRRILIGEVVHALSREGFPLVRFRSSYCEIATETIQAANAHTN